MKKFHEENATVSDDILCDLSKFHQSLAVIVHCYVPSTVKK